MAVTVIHVYTNQFYYVYVGEFIPPPLNRMVNGLVDPFLPLIPAPHARPTRRRGRPAPVAPAVRAGAASGTATGTAAAVHIIASRTPLKILKEINANPSESHLKALSNGLLSPLKGHEHRFKSPLKALEARHAASRRSSRSPGARRACGRPGPSWSQRRC